MGSEFNGNHSLVIANSKVEINTFPNKFNLILVVETLIRQLIKST